MANIDDYIAQLSKEINRKGSGYSFIESNRMSEAIKYKETLKRSEVIIAKMEEIEKRYTETTTADNYNEEDKQEYLQLKEELDKIQEIQEEISFSIPNQYKGQEVSFYRYKQAGEIGEKVIAEMEGIRNKYFPEPSLENFSEVDRNRYNQLEQQLDELDKTQRDLDFHVHPNVRYEFGELSSRKRAMEQVTSGKIPKIARYELMDSDFLRENFETSMKLAKIAVDRELEALEAGDYTRAMKCSNVYSVAFSNFSAHYWGENDSKLLSEYIENKLGEKHQEILQNKLEEYQSVSSEMSNEELISIFSDYRSVTTLCHTSKCQSDKHQLYGIIEKAVKDKIGQLDIQLTELKEHIELPENEAKIEKIQNQIETLEIAWSSSMARRMTKEKSEHQKARLEEQGIDMSEIMKDIEYTSKRKGRIYQDEYDKINEAVSKKSAYLEGKLTYLQQYKDIPGNEERIAEIESQIEKMQDSWVIASTGVDLQAIIEKNNAKIDEKRARLPEAEKELAYTIKNEPSKVGLIQRLRFEVTELMRGINELENENSSIQDGTNKKYIGEHHKGRIDNDEKIKAEQEEKIKLQKERIEQKQKEIAEQEENAKAEREERIKKANEERAKRREEEILKEKQAAKAKEEQARIKAEQEAKKREEEKARQEAIDKDIREYEQYEELTTQKPEIEDLYQELFYGDFSASASGTISNDFLKTIEKIKDLPVNERKILLCRFNKNADFQIGMDGNFLDDKVRTQVEQEAKAKAEEQARIKAEQEAKARAEEQARIKAEQEAKARAEEQAKKSTTSKMYDEQQEELVKPREKSFRDQIGDDLQKENENKEMLPRKDPTIEMWMNRFGSWYSAIDRVSQNVKAKFVQMKSEIVNAIKNKIQERENRKEKIEQQNKEVEEEGR